VWCEEATLVALAYLAISLLHFCQGLQASAPAVHVVAVACERESTKHCLTRLTRLWRSLLDTSSPTTSIILSSPIHCRLDIRTDFSLVFRPSLSASTVSRIANHHSQSLRTKDAIEVMNNASAGIRSLIESELLMRIARTANTQPAGNTVLRRIDELT
jgi:hypothetical protein